jgi:hypothetical protein
MDNATIRFKGRAESFVHGIGVGTVYHVDDHRSDYDTTPERFLWQVFFCALLRPMIREK